MAFNIPFFQRRSDSKQEEVLENSSALIEKIANTELNLDIQPRRTSSSPSDVIAAIDDNQKLKSSNTSSSKKAQELTTKEVEDKKRAIRRFRFTRRREEEKVEEVEETPANRRDVFFSALQGANPINRRNQAVEDRILNEEEQIDEALRKKLSKVKVIAFVGTAGTGKSTRANRVAKERGIDYFIDDALLIEDGYILAGSTAKKAKTRIESVRLAMFFDEATANNMRRAIADLDTDKLMILGTSDGMVYKICENLWLNPPAEFIRISDVSSPEEQESAKFTRKTQGSHAIPVTSMEIKHEFSGAYYDPIRVLRRRFAYDVEEVIAGSQRTIVRPTFSSKGSNVITDEAMTSLIELLLTEVEALADITDLEVRTSTYGALLNLEISVYYGYNAQDVMNEIQEILIEQVEFYTSINILGVNVICRRVQHRRDEEWRKENRYIQYR